MNERIKELYGKAHEEQSPISGQGRLTKDILWEQPRKFNPEKFAELLLQECVDACWRANKISYSVPPTQQQVALDCAREIETALRS